MLLKALEGTNRIEFIDLRQQYPPLKLSRLNIRLNK